MADDYYITGIGISQYFYGAQRMGLPSEKILRKCGMTPEVVLQPMEHTSIDQFERFLLELILESGDELFGLHIGEQVMPAIYGVFPTVITMAGSVREALEAAIRYQALVAGNAGKISILDEDDESMLFEGILAYPNPVVRRHILESMIVFINKMLCFIFGSSALPVLSIQVEHAFTSEEAQSCFENALGCPVIFSASNNRIRLSKTILNIPMNAYGEDAMHAVEALAKLQLDEQQRHMGQIDQIKLQVRSLMASSKPRRETVADRLGISVRTLDRRLIDAGLSWRQLVDGLRSQLAHQLLRDHQQSVNSIAARLGFSDARSFQRRFRHWTGMSPSEYRDSLVRNK